MIRTIVLTVALTGAVGFALGWLMFAPRSNQVPADEPAALADVTHTFELLPADVQCDRETPALCVDPEGRLTLAWSSQTGELERTLWLTRSLDGGVTFEAPVAFRKVPIHRHVRKMDGKERAFTSNVLPRLATHQSVVYLGWVEAVQGGPRVDYLLARSHDGGKTFDQPVTVHSDAASRPGYTALAVDGAGVVTCAWLDGRNKSQQPFCSVSSVAGTTAGKPFAAEQLVYAGADKGICPCCDLAATRSADGATFVAFRNAKAGYRDIWIARADDGAGFDAAVPVTHDHWRFDGCPHDGPTLALTGDRLHVAWMDAHAGKRRVYFASSPLTDLTFAPRELASSAPGDQGHPKIIAAANGMLHLVWDGSLQEDAPEPASETGHHHHGARLQGSGRAIVYTRSPDAGNNFAPPRMIAPRPGAFQIQPALAVSSTGVVFVAWNELSTTGKSVVFARLSSYVPPCCR